MALASWVMAVPSSMWQWKYLTQGDYRRCRLRGKRERVEWGPEASSHLATLPASNISPGPTNITLNAP